MAATPCLTMSSVAQKHDRPAIPRAVTGQGRDTFEHMNKTLCAMMALLLGASCAECRGQSRVVIPPVYGHRVIDGDTIPAMRLATIPVYSKRRIKRVNPRKYERLVRAVKLVYPMAMDAQNRLRQMEADLPALDRKEQQEYVRRLERQLKEQYTPVLKKMSMYQGMVLIKLIDRQTGRSSYHIVQEFRGRLSAFFWQGIARMFGGNLKAEYDPGGDDAVLEQIIELYELGML